MTNYSGIGFAPYNIGNSLAKILTSLFGTISNLHINSGDLICKMNNRNTKNKSVTRIDIKLSSINFPIYKRMK